MNEIDIINIHKDICKKFEKEKTLVDDYTEKMRELENLKNIPSLSLSMKKNLDTDIRMYMAKIEECKSEKTFYMYINETYNLLEQYKTILNTPLKISFTNKPVKKSKEKHNIIVKYINIAQKYHDIDVDIPEMKKKVKCTCGNKELHIIEDNIYVCMKCGEEHKISINTSSYKDVDRINVGGKYQYDRLTHFRDCINQYQGKQNSNIEDTVYEELMQEFENHGLLMGKKTDDSKKRCKNITHEHIGLFLKELKYSKHYENINLIHYKLTGIKPDDISHLEDMLLNDFIILTDLYDKRYKKEKQIVRKNFINTQYVLYQLLCKHRHPCKREDFNILKTIERQVFHDEVCQTLFNELEWTFTPYI